MPRLRLSAGTSTFAMGSTNVVASQRIAPRSGFTKPAIDSRVVVLPQPLGPSKVTNSPSATVKLTSSSTTFSPKRLVRFSMLTLGTTVTSGSGFEQDGGEGQHPDGDRELQYGERGGGAG